MPREARFSELFPNGGVGLSLGMFLSREEMRDPEIRAAKIQELREASETDAVVTIYRLGELDALPQRTATATRATRSGPCVHLGDLAGYRDCSSCKGTVRVKVFTCHHPDHETTTIRECGQCPDYEAKD